jgi:hypothetical protein
MSKEFDNKITDPSVRRLFEDKNFVFISSIMKDVSPQVTPTWVDIENGNIVVNTAICRIKTQEYFKGSSSSIGDS